MVSPNSAYIVGVLVAVGRITAPPKNGVTFWGAIGAGMERRFDGVRSVEIALTLELYDLDELCTEHVPGRLNVSLRRKSRGAFASMGAWQQRLATCGVCKHRTMEVTATRR